MGASGFEVVFVCTGNRARSPLAAALLRQQVGADVRVRSVGTLDVGSVPALPPAVRAGLRAGADISAHRSHELQPHELSDADLVVGFEPGHISAAVVDGRADAARTFSMIELGELLEALRDELPAPTQPDQVIRAAHAHRTVSFLAAPALADPYGGSDAVFMQALDVIDRHVKTIADVVFGAFPSH